MTTNLDRKVRTTLLSVWIAIIGLTPLIAQLNPNDSDSLIGRKVKLYFSDGESLTGIIREWRVAGIVLQSDTKGDLKIDPKKVVKAVHAETTPNPMQSTLRTPSQEIDNKEEWQKKLATVKSTQIVLYFAGGIVSAVGLGVTSTGVNQIQNAKLKVKGNVITNEDDINEGRQKVLIGSSLTTAGVLLVIWGVNQNDYIRSLEELGRKKGFSLSLKPEMGEIRLCYNYRF